MQFTVLPSDLKQAYSSLTSALSNKNIMPVFDNILMTPSDDASSMRLTASDGNVLIVTTMPISEATDLVPSLIGSKVLASYISKALDVFPVSFECDGREWCISDTCGEFRVACFDEPSEYPADNTCRVDETATSVVVSASKFISCLVDASSFIAKDELRLIMSGIYVNFTSDGMNIAACDSKRLFSDCIRDVNTVDSYEVVIPGRIVSCIGKLFNTGPDDILEVSFSNKCISIRQNDTIVRGQLIEGKYPRYKSIIPSDKTLARRAEVSISKLVSGIKRASIAANGNTNSVKFQFDGSSMLTLSAQDVDVSTSATVKLPTESQSDLAGFTIAMRGDFVRDVVSVVGSDNTIMKLSEPNRAVVFCSSSAPDRILLVMPMAYN